MLTDEQLAALDEAEKKATPGPYYIDWTSSDTAYFRNKSGEYYLRMDVHGIEDVRRAEYDLEFIALARNHMRALLDEVQMWRGSRLKQILDQKGLNIGAQILKAPWEEENEKLRADCIVQMQIADGVIKENSKYKAELAAARGCALACR